MQRGARARTWPGRRPATGWMPKRTLMPLARSALTSSAMSYCAPATARPYLPRPAPLLKPRSIDGCQHSEHAPRFSSSHVGHCYIFLLH